MSNSSTTIFSAALRRSIRSLYRSPRAFSSPPFSAANDDLPPPPSPPREDDLRSRIFRLRLPKRSATAALDKWVAEGRGVSAPDLRRIARDLRRSQRYKHALEIITWMESLGNLTLSPRDHAIRLDLITKVGNLAEAEEYYAELTNISSRKAASSFLLHYYVKGRNVEKAEALMVSLQNMGLVVDPLLFNEMMKLYMATGQFEKVFIVIGNMKSAKISLNVLSYNLWISACGEKTDLLSVEMVYKEMMNDKTVEVGWSTDVTLANIYAKCGFNEKAISALKQAEEKLSVRSRLAYFFIMTSYAALRDRAGVIRLWEYSKRVPGRMTCVNYMCIISCLIKVDDIEEAERVFRSWESGCRKYDVRVSNVLLGAYMRKGLIEKAESFHIHTLRKGGKPNYKTLEILMEGWLKAEQIDKAVDAMQKAFSMLKDCDWRPSLETVMAIAHYHAEKGNNVALLEYVHVLQRLGLMNLPLYKLVLRAHLDDKKTVAFILKMIAKDNIDFDDEIRDLLVHMTNLNTVDMLST